MRAAILEVYSDSQRCAQGKSDWDCNPPIIWSFFIPADSLIDVVLLLLYLNT